MTVVVDASVILKWIFPEQGSQAAAALRSSDLIAPSIWIAEAGNALWRRAARGEIDLTQARRLLRELRTAPLTVFEMEDDLDAALSLSVELNHPIYDCLYLALAVRQDTHCITADRRFAALASKRAELRGRVQPLT
ncbi:MAG TPA: type II toxin-antitoxin system VapC family toxin [Rhizomicrobium sp.]|jgi:predicted nucleic acid-binding protein